MKLSYYPKFVKKAYKLIFPLEKREILEPLKAGDFLLISGWLLCARDFTHKKIISAIKEGSFSFDFTNQAIYYVGPTKAPPGKIIGSAGPTTSKRMDPYMEFFLKLGISATIGKGKRSPEVKELLKKYKAVYLATFGGAGAFLNFFIKKVETITFEELGPEAFFRIKVENFPAIVINSIYGDDFYEKVLSYE
jgi:fumarate hydratase subunit beta